MRALLASLVVVALAGCGGLDNDPLTLGVIRGALSRADATGWVSILGRPETRVALSATGTFEFSGVPHGNIDVIAIANSKEALRKVIEVQGGGLSDVGQLNPRPGGFLEIKVETHAQLLLTGGKVTVDGVPYEVHTDEDGDADIGPLPQGCYTVEFSIPGVGAKKVSACTVEGEGQHVYVEFPAPDGSQGREGCSVTGCQVGFACEANGACG